DMDASEAKQFVAPWKHLEQTAKPARDALKGQIHESCFWKFWDRRDELYERAKPLGRVIWSSPRKVDRGLTVFPFVLRRGNVPQRRVPPLAVVEDLDVLHDRRPGLRPGGEAGVMDQPLLQRGEEALHGSVVPAVRPAAHAARDPVPGQQALVVV